MENNLCIVGSDEDELAINVHTHESLRAGDVGIVSSIDKDGIATLGFPDGVSELYLILPDCDFGNGTEIYEVGVATRLSKGIRIKIVKSAISGNKKRYVTFSKNSHSLMWTNDSDIAIFKHLMDDEFKWRENIDSKIMTFPSVVLESV